MSQDQFRGDLRSSEGVWETLSQVTVKGAEYDSRERQPHPKCLEGTRVVLLNYIYGLLDAREESRIIWLHGTAGIGKSAVAFTVAERMRDLKVREETTIEKRLAGTFFFSCKHTKRCTTSYFFATLAYQLARKFPSIRGDVNRAILENPALLDPDTSLRNQMEALFLRPLRRLRSRLHECLPLTFVVDALDECTSESEIADLISLLGEALRQPDLPVTHVLLTSRSELHVRKAIQREEMRPLVCEIPLNTFGEGVAATAPLDGAEVDNDIYIFLQHSFRELETRHPDFPQPSTDQLRRLASRAGRRFIVASTMMKFIDDRDNDPRNRLQLMLDLTSNLVPGTEVYKLYDLILSTCADPGRAYLHLSVVASLADPLPMSQISKLLGPSQGRDVETVLVQLRSVIDIPTDNNFPVNIYHSSIRDYVSDLSNCSLPQVQHVTPPHPLLTYSSLHLMIHDIPESRALLDALSELTRQNQTIQPHDTQSLKDSLSFIVQPPEPLQVLIGLLWLYGDRHSELQFWLGTLDGRAWLRTQGGKDWLETERGRGWLETPNGLHWVEAYSRSASLESQRDRDSLEPQTGRNWLETPSGREWLETQIGQEWLQIPRGHEWLQTQSGLQWLQAPSGEDWLLTLDGRRWLGTQNARESLSEQERLRIRQWLETTSRDDLLLTPEGQDYLEPQSGREWLHTPSGLEWLQTQRGWDWLQAPSGRRWLQAPSGRKWLLTPGGRGWLESPNGREWLQAQSGRGWLQTISGREWLQTPGGRAWLESPSGREWLQAQSGRDWLQTISGRKWLQTPKAWKWLKTQSGREWVQTPSGDDWLLAPDGRQWLQTQSGGQWLQSQRGQEWLQMESGRKWLQTLSGRKWLQIQAGRQWLRTQHGQEWLQTHNGRQWLQTQNGRDWLQTVNGRDWLQTPHGQAWQSTPAASVRDAMEEFSNTLEAIIGFGFAPELGLQPAFQTIQQFKSMPNFLMFPAFLALRRQDHSVSALSRPRFLPNTEIIHAMTAFAIYANGARERSRSTSGALKYACQNWAFHLSRTPNPWDDVLSHTFTSFWNNHLLSWLERQWCLKGLRSCLIILSDGQELAKEHLELQSSQSRA